jgi:hypothetical protein
MGSSIVLSLIARKQSKVGRNNTQRPVLKILALFQYERQFLAGCGTVARTRGPSFPAKRDFPTGQIPFVGRNPQVRKRQIKDLK